MTFAEHSDHTNQQNSVYKTGNRGQAFDFAIRRTSMNSYRSFGPRNRIAPCRSEPPHFGYEWV